MWVVMSVCLSVPKIQIVYRWRDLGGIRYGRYATGDYHKIVLSSCTYVTNRCSWCELSHHWQCPSPRLPNAPLTSLTEHSTTWQVRGIWQTVSKKCVFLLQVKSLIIFEINNYATPSFNLECQNPHVFPAWYVMNRHAISCSRERHLLPLYSNEAH